MAGIPGPEQNWYGKHVWSHFLSTWQAYLVPLLLNMASMSGPQHSFSSKHSQSTPIVEKSFSVKKIHFLLKNHFLDEFERDLIAETIIRKSIKFLNQNHALWGPENAGKTWKWLTRNDFLGCSVRLILGFIQLLFIITLYWWVSLFKIDWTFRAGIQF